MKEKTLILIRHAHRDKDLGPGADNGLSEKGREQSKRLADHFRARLSGCNVLFLTSPKKRCVETIEAVAASVKKSADQTDGPKIDALLGEGTDMLLRNEKFFEWWKSQAPDLVVACSHGDWIPSFVQSTVGIEIPLKKAAYVQLNLLGSRPILSWLVQRVD